MKSRRLRFMIALVVVLLFAMGFMILTIPMKRDIDISISGIKGRVGDSKYSEPVTIRVQGVYSNFFISEDRFEGDIDISGYRISSEYVLNELVFSDGYSNLRYWNGDDESMLIGSYFDFGVVLCTDNFEEVLVFHNESMITEYVTLDDLASSVLEIEEDDESWISNGCTYICAPASDIAESIEIVNSFMEYEIVERVSWN